MAPNPYSMYGPPEEKAKSLLVHYFKLATYKSDRDLDSDCIGEIGSIVDAILAAARQPQPTAPLGAVEVPEDWSEAGLERLEAAVESLTPSSIIPREQTQAVVETLITAALRQLEFWVRRAGGYPRLAGPEVEMAISHLRTALRLGRLGKGDD